MKNIIRSLLIALVLSTPISPCFAEDSVVRSSNRAIEFNAGECSFDYKETSSSGATMNTEKGWMPCLAVNSTWLTSSSFALTNNVYLHFDARKISGDTDYDGYLMTSRGNIPYKSTTNNNLYDISGRIGKYLALGNEMALTPYVGFAHRRWNRELTGVGGYSETYYNDEITSGLLLQKLVGQNFILSLSGEVGSTLDPGMTGLGREFTLGKDIVWRINGRIGYIITNSIEITGNVRFENMSFKQSNVVRGYYEPDSQTQQTSLTVGVAYHL